ncbi:MAG: hypothetical protein IKA72_02645 [Clostridia bacterium]|nr:hypothetical protein [Clostridia bacterium]
MTTDSKKRKQLLALFLSAMMASSFAALAACKDNEDEQQPETETEDTASDKDTARLTNGSFEFYDDKDGKNLIITSPGSWSRSNASGGVTSKAASGIINTEDSAWKNLTQGSGHSYATVEDAEKNWDKLSAKDKLAFYDAQEDEDELDFYQNFNIDSEDLPTCENPGTHYASDDTNASKNTNVLMIHNDYNVSGKYGTAQKFASSTTITLSAGTYAELSVWVKTSDLKYSTKAQDVLEGRGAYIDVTQTVGSTTLDTLQVKNINTEVQANQTENNGWVNYKFYLQSCSYSSSTVKVTLGLGQATVSTNTSEYVGGYAFFDDVTCKIYDAADWSTATSTVNTKLNMASSKTDKIIDADVNSDTTFSMDMDSHNTGFKNFSFASSAKTELTTEEAGNGKVYASAGDKQFVGLTIDNKNDFAGSVTFATLDNYTHPLVSKVRDNITKPSSFESDVMYLIASEEGAAYTTTIRPNDSYYELGAGKYAVYSFFLKTSDLAGHTGASVKFTEFDKINNEFKDFGNEAVISSVDTSSVDSVDLTIDTVDGETTREDIYEGWQQCFFFLENDTEETRYFQIQLTYGTTTIVNSKDQDYYGGFVALANFQTRTLAPEEYDFVSAGTYSKTFSLTGFSETETTGQVFDEASSVSGDITTGLANPLTYKGVYGGSGYVNGTSTDTRLNENKYAGLINKKYYNDVDDTTDEGWVYDSSEQGVVNTAIKNALTNNNLTLGNSTQPLVIYNTEEQAYGFIGGSKTISATTHSAISVRVKATQGAVVNIYLIDNNDATHESVLTWKAGVTYWYNDDGDLCAKDPSADDFNKKTDVAFTLQENGLYLVNEKWSGYAASGVAKDQYYANLANYEGYGEGDLLVADNGVEYNYNDKWSNQGNDGIAFYYKDGKYFAYDNYTTEVKDFSTVPGITTRSAKAEKKLQATVTGTGEDLWTTVTFYIYTGSNIKNYRLEVWSGSRDGSVKNAAESLVLVDLGGANALTDDSFSSILTKVKENVEDIGDPYYFGESYESGFSFYDSNSFLRYDATLDENEVGNSYESYLSSAYSVDTAYMNYQDKINLTNMIFVDFSLSEESVDADVEQDETEDEEVETTTPSDTNIWLLVSSIAIAVILLLAIISIIVRKYVMKARKRKGYNTVSVQSVAPARKVKEKKTEETDKDAE